MKAAILVKRFIPILALYLLCPFGVHLSAYEVNTTDIGVEVRWAAPSTTYYVNEAGGPSGSLAAFQGAMQTWTSVNNSAFSFVYGGPTISGAHGVNDGVNIVSFGLIDPSELAENRFWYDTVTGHIYDSDIRLNTRYSFSTNPSGFVYDLQTVALHELGHALSLKDLCGTGDTNKVMYCQVWWAQIRRSLSQDDIDGVVHLYPPSSCTYTISPSVQNFYSGGGAGTVTVAPGSSKCAWTAASNDPWIIITSGASGSGNGTTGFSVVANTGTSSRSGTMTIAGNTMMVTQSGVQQHLLSVAKAGNGYGTVASSSPGIDCGNDCSEFFEPGASVTLNALADSGYLFNGWSGSCTGQGACAVTMTSDRSVTAVFDRQLGGEFSLNLSPGWNFVSVPVNPVNPAMTSVLKDISSDVSIVWGYDNENKAWLKYVPAAAGGAALSSFDQGKGYWIYMLDNRTLTVIADQTVPRDVRLHGGWNLVGYSGNDGLAVENALSDLDKNWNILWGWDKGQWSVAASYNLSVPQSISRLSTLKRGRALWIKRTAWGQPIDWKTDLTPPVVQSVDPSDNSHDVPVDKVASLSFDKNLDCSTITPTNLYLSTGSTRVDGVVGCTENKATFIPSAALSYDKTYTLTALAEIKDLKGNSLQSGHTYSFTTVPSPGSLVRIGKIGDTLVYDMTMTASGIQFRGDLTIRLSGTVTNPYGVVCQVYDMAGILTGGGKSIPISAKSIDYQDAQGSYDCGNYDSATGQYNFIQDRPNTPNGLCLALKSPTRVGDVISPGTIYYQDQSWTNCSYMVSGMETITVPAGTFETFKVEGSCSKSNGDSYSFTNWAYPQIRDIKEYNRYLSGVEGGMTLKSYTLAP